MITPGEKGRTEYIYIGIVNIGHRESQITNINWKTGIIKKQYAIFTMLTNDSLSSELPIKLRDGAEARYFIPLKDDKQGLKDFANIMTLSPCPRLQSYFVKVQVSTSIGDTFETRIEKGLRKMLVEILKDRKKQ